MGKTQEYVWKRGDRCVGKWIEGEERLGKSGNPIESHGIILGFLEKRTLEGSGKIHVGKWKLIEAHRTSWKVLEHST